MKKVLIIVVFFTLCTWAGDHNKSENNTTKTMTKKQVDLAIEQEEKFAKEQKFYTEESYDFKGSEVNPESLKKVPIIPMDDPDIDSESILGMD